MIYIICMSIVLYLYNFLWRQCTVADSTCTNLKVEPNHSEPSHHDITEIVCWEELQDPIGLCHKQFVLLAAPSDLGWNTLGKQMLGCHDATTDPGQRVKSNHLGLSRGRLQHHWGWTQLLPNHLLCWAGRGFRRHLLMDRHFLGDQKGPHHRPQPV